MALRFWASFFGTGVGEWHAGRAKKDTNMDVALDVSDLDNVARACIADVGVDGEGAVRVAGDKVGQEWPCDGFGGHTGWRQV